MQTKQFRVIKRFKNVTFVRPYDGGGCTIIHHLYNELRKNADIFIQVDIHELQRQYAAIDLRVAVSPLLDELRKLGIEIGRVNQFDMQVSGRLPISIASRVFSETLDYVNQTLPAVLGIDVQEIAPICINGYHKT